MWKLANLQKHISLFQLNLWREDLDLTDQEDESDSEEIKKSRTQRNFESLKHLIENGRDLEGESSSEYFSIIVLLKHFPSQSSDASKICF